MDLILFSWVNVLVCRILIAVTHLCLSIANAYISSQTKKARDEGGENIWACIVTLSVLGLLAFFNGIWQIFQMFSIYTNDEKKNINYFAICYMGVSIWAYIAYYNADFNNDTFQMLWNMLLVNVIFFFVNIILTVWVLVSSYFILYTVINNNQNLQGDINEFTLNV